MYIRRGYGTVFPYSLVSDAKRYVSFLKNVFNAEEIGRPVMKGWIANVGLRIATSAFMVSVDPFGNTWWISIRLVRKGYDE